MTSLPYFCLRTKLLSATACLLVTVCAWPEPANALSLLLQCMNEQQKLAMLGSAKYLEREALNALINVEGVRAILEIWSGAATSSVVLVLPSGLNCLLASGDQWRLVPQPPLVTGEDG